jgi:hypothetical protein
MAGKHGWQAFANGLASTYNGEAGERHAKVFYSQIAGPAQILPLGRGRPWRIRRDLLGG